MITLDIVTLKHEDVNWKVVGKEGNVANPDKPVIIVNRFTGYVESDKLHNGDFCVSSVQDNSPVYQVVDKGYFGISAKEVGKIKYNLVLKNGKYSTDALKIDPEKSVINLVLNGATK